MFSPLFPPPPGYQPPQISFWFAMALTLASLIVIFLAMLLAALQFEREERKRAAGNGSRSPERKLDS